MNRTYKDYIQDVLSSFRYKKFRGNGRSPWKYIAGMRDKLIHEYHGVDLEIVWKVVKKEAPPLKPLFEKILMEIKE